MKHFSKSIVVYQLGNRAKNNDGKRCYVNLMLSRNVYSWGA